MHWGHLTEKLSLKDGIFFAGSSQGISYPSEANDIYFAIEERSFWFEHRAHCITQAVRNFPSSGMIFDVGGGNGHVSSVLEKNGFETVLVEPGLPGVLNAKQRGLKRLVCATIDSACFPKASLPAIGLFDVLEHIEDDRSFLILIHEMLKPDGMLYLTVPAYQSLWSAEDQYAGHYRRYTLDALKEKLETTGFKISYGTYIFSFLTAFILFFRRLPFIFSFGKTSSSQAPAKDHVVENKFFKKILKKISQYEASFVRDKKRIWIGGTCLVVARAINKG